MMHSLRLLTLLFFCSLGVFAQYPDDVEQNLKKAGTNRPELEKAISYCQKTKDPLKLKAIYFLIRNMDIHFTADYYWESKEGKKIAYNELDYPDFAQAMKAFEDIKTQYPGLQPKRIIYKDLETIKGDFLIDNLEKAFKAWKNAPVQPISFADFCDYILPYRISVEPLQEWRTIYATKYAWMTEKIQSKGLETALNYLQDDTQTWFSNTWNKGGRKEPLPRLGSQQLLLRKQGPCGDLADLGVFTMRSLGVPATIDAIPFWATSTGSHILNAFFDTNSKPIVFEFGDKKPNEKLKREPSKVLRYTYSKQPLSLCYYEKPNLIPPGVLRESNCIDVTNEYWQTTTIESPLYPNANKPKTAYLATFNGLSWQTFGWGKVENNQALWHQICVGTVILPQYYQGEKMIPAAPPILATSHEIRVLKPDVKQLQTLTITAATGYLILKPGVSYKLFYWDDDWKLVATQTATESTISLQYEKVPKNALLLLVGSDTRGFERPFVVDESGVRSWF